MASILERELRLDEAAEDDRLSRRRRGEVGVADGIEPLKSSRRVTKQVVLATCARSVPAASSAARTFSIAGRTWRLTLPGSTSPPTDSTPNAGVVQGVPLAFIGWEQLAPGAAATETAVRRLTNASLRSSLIMDELPF